jgi:hypothetical protein
MATGVETATLGGSSGLGASPLRMAQLRLRLGYFAAIGARFLLHKGIEEMIKIAWAGWYRQHEFNKPNFHAQKAYFFKRT